MKMGKAAGQKGERQTERRERLQKNDVGQEQQIEIEGGCKQDGEKMKQ